MDNTNMKTIETCLILFIKWCSDKHSVRQRQRKIKKARPPRASYMTPWKHGLVETWKAIKRVSGSLPPCRRQWKAVLSAHKYCHMNHVKTGAGYAKWRTQTTNVTYFVGSDFGNLVQECLHFWILTVVPVYCWHKVRQSYRYCKCVKIAFSNCVWLFTKCDVWIF